MHKSKTGIYVTTESLLMNDENYPKKATSQVVQLLSTMRTVIGLVGPVTSFGRLP